MCLAHMSVSWQYGLRSTEWFFWSQLGSHTFVAKYWSAWRICVLAVYKQVQCGQLYLILQLANSSLFPGQLGSKTSQSMKVCWGLCSKLAHCHIYHILLAKQVISTAQILEMGISFWWKELQSHSQGMHKEELRIL